MTKIPVILLVIVAMSASATDASNVAMGHHNEHFRQPQYGQHTTITFSHVIRLGITQ